MFDPCRLDGDNDPYGCPGRPEVSYDGSDRRALCLVAQLAVQGAVNSEAEGSSPS